MGSGDNKLYALDAQTGTIQWSYKTNGAIYSSPAIVDGVVYVGSTDNNVYAIGSTTLATGLGMPLDTHLMILTVLAAFFVAIAVILIILCRQSK